MFRLDGRAPASPSNFEGGGRRRKRRRNDRLSACTVGHKGMTLALDGFDY
jgi:hypothetical protein